jgi:hypothetical protein
MFGEEYKRFREATPIGIPFMAARIDTVLERLAAQGR